MTDMLVCPRCDSPDIKRAGSIVAARGRVQRWECQECWKKFHPSLLSLPIKGIDGYLDIETSQAGRGAGNFGIVYSWAIKTRRGILVSDVTHDTILKEERRILEHLEAVLPDYDRLYTWYGTGHDIPILRTRFERHGLRFPGYMDAFHVDLYYASRGRLRLHSNRLEAVAQFFGIKGKTPLDPEVWVQAAYGDTQAKRDNALGYILKHNVGDVIILEQVHRRMERYYRGINRSI